MANYKKRTQERIRRGIKIAEFLGLEPNKRGFYETEWGNKSPEGLYLSVRNFLKKLQKKT